jgi:predicted peptidase
MGGTGVYDIAARLPDRFAALVAISGVVPLDDSTLVKRIQHIPITIFHGASDERVPVEGARRLVPDLKKAGAAVKYTEYADTRHGPTAEKTYADPIPRRMVIVATPEGTDEAIRAISRQQSAALTADC